MTMQTSQLSVQVKSDGIDKVIAKLDELQLSAKNTEVSTKSLSTAVQNIGSGLDTNSTIAKLLALSNGVQGLISTFSNLTSTSSASVNTLTNSLTAAITRIQALEATAQQANAAIIQVSTGLGSVSNALNHTNTRSNVFNNTLRSMTTAALAYTGVNFAVGIFKEADAWSMMQSKLKLAVGSMELAKSVQGDLFTMSQNLRVPLEDTAKLFTRMSIPLQRMGQTVGDVKKVVESFSMALKLGGATGQEASSAMLQLSQSFNAGRLNGGEFNSVAEAAPSVLRAIEIELVRVGKGADLAKHGLKELASRGVLSAEVMAEALKRAAPKWAEEFKQLPLTVDGAMTRIKNAWQKAVGEIGQDTKFNAKLAEALKTIEDLLPTIAKTVANAFLFMVTHGEMLVKTLGALLIVILAIKAAALAATIQAAYIAPFTVLTGVSTVLTGGLVGVRAALLAIGITPVGLAITAVAVIIGGLVTLLGKKKEAWEGAKEAADKVKDNEALLKSMKLETLAMMEQADVARVKASLPPLYTKEIEDAKKATQATSALTVAKTTAAKVEEEIFEWKKRQRLNTSIGRNEYYLPQRLKDGRANAIKIVAIEEIKNKELKKQDNIGLDQVKSATKDRMDTLAKAYALEVMTVKQRADAIKTEDEAELKRMKVQGLAPQALLDKQAIIDREYQEAIDKIKTKRGASVRAATQVELTEIQKLKIAHAELLQQKQDLEKYGVDDKRTKSEKEYTRLVEEGALAKGKSLKEDYARRIEQASLSKQLEDSYIALKTKMTLEKESIADADKKIENAKAELASNQALLNSEEKRVEVLAKLASATEFQKYQEMVSGTSATQVEIDKQYELYIIKQKNAEVVGEKVDKDDTAKKALESQKVLDKLFDTKRVDKWTESMNKGLKGIAAAFTPLIVALDKWKAKEATIAEARRENFSKNSHDFKEMAKVEKDIQDKETDYKLASYTEVADGMKNMFKEGTKGHQAMDTASKVLHAAQLARNLAEMAQLAIKGVMTQAGGDPISALPRMAAMAAIMAGLGYATGVFGSSGKGGKSAADVQKSQNKGTVFGDADSVSMSMANSLSLLEKNSEKLLPVNTSMLVALNSINRGITGLSQAVFRTMGLSGGTNMGIQEGTISKAGSGGLLSALPPIAALVGLWGKTTQTIKDAGVNIQGSLDTIKNGGGASQYASVDTTKSSWFGLKKSTSNSVQTQNLGGEASKQIGLIFGSMQVALEAAGKSMFGTSTEVTKALESVVINAGVSLKGLTGQALTDALSAMVSGALDQMASAAFKEFDQFRVQGEGFAQTVIRVADSFANVNQALQFSGKKILDFGMAGIKTSQDLVNAAGGLDKFQSMASFFSENFLSDKEKLEPKILELRKRMEELGQGSVTTMTGFKNLVTGLDLTDSAQATLYVELLKLAPAFKEIQGVVEEVTGSLNKIKEEHDSLTKIYDDLVLSTKTVTEQQNIYAATLDTSNVGIYRSTLALQAKIDAEKAVEDQRKSLQEELNDLVMTSAEKQAEYKKTISESNMNLYSQIQAIKDKTEAEAKNKESIESMKTSVQEFAKESEKWLNIKQKAADLSGSISEVISGNKKDPTSRMKDLWDAMAKDVTPEQKLQLAGELKDLVLNKYQLEKENITNLISFSKNLKGYVEGLKLGSLSPLTMTAKLTEAKRQYDETLSKAQGGDKGAQDKLTGVSSTYLELARTAFASNENYSQIFNSVTSTLDGMGIVAQSAAELGNGISANQLTELLKIQAVADGIHSTATSYYNSNLNALASQLNLLDSMNKQMGVWGSLVPIISSLPASIAAALSGSVGTSVSDDAFLRNLYKMVEGRVGTQIDTAGYNYWMKEIVQYGRAFVDENFKRASAQNKATASPPPNAPVVIAANSITVELTELRKSLDGLRADQEAQTEKIVVSNVVALSDNANTVNAGALEAASKASWAESTAPALS